MLYKAFSLPSECLQGCLLPVKKTTTKIIVHTSNDMCVLSTMCGSTQEHQFDVMSTTTEFLLFFFSVFVACSPKNYKGAYCHLLCVDVALVKWTKGICIFFFYICWLPITYLFYNCADHLSIPYISCIPRNKGLVLKKVKLAQFI